MTSDLYGAAGLHLDLPDGGEAWSGTPGRVVRLPALLDTPRPAW